MAQALFVGGFQQAWTKLFMHFDGGANDFPRELVGQHGRRQFTAEGTENCTKLSDGDFFVSAEDIAHGVADFAECGVRFHCVEDVGHKIFFSLRGLT